MPKDSQSSYFFSKRRSGSYYRKTFQFKQNDMILRKATIVSCNWLYSTVRHFFSRFFSKESRNLKNCPLTTLMDNNLRFRVWWKEDVVSMVKHQDQTF